MSFLNVQRPCCHIIRSKYSCLLMSMWNCLVPGPSSYIKICEHSTPFYRMALDLHVTNSHFPIALNLPFRPRTANTTSMLCSALWVGDNGQKNVHVQLQLFFSRWFWSNRKDFFSPHCVIGETIFLDSWNLKQDHRYSPHLPRGKKRCHMSPIPKA